MRRMVIALAFVSAIAIVPFVSGSAEPSPTFSKHQVRVYFTRTASIEGGNCGVTIGYLRHTVGQDVLHDTMNWLLKGPRQSEEEKVSSLFSRRTAGMVNSVTIESGVAYIDFDDLRNIIPNASTSCGSTSLLAELDRTAEQFPTVDRAVYSFEGSVEAFYGWLQLDAPK